MVTLEGMRQHSFQSESLFKPEEQSNGVYVDLVSMCPPLTMSPPIQPCILYR